MNTDPRDRQPRRASVIELLGDMVTPVQVYQALSQDSLTAFLFESSEHDSKLARFSIIGVDPLELIEIRQKQATVTFCDSKSEQFVAQDPFTFLRDRHAVGVQDFSKEGVPEFLPFTCGLAGYIGYAAAGVKSEQADPLNVPDVMMGFFDSCVVFDHLLRRVFIISYRSRAYAQLLQSKLENARGLRTLPVSGKSPLTQDCFDGVETAMSREAFLGAVAKCKEYICQGQAFQIVMSQRFFTPVRVESLDIYRMLQSINPSPYAYFLKFPQLNYLGSSPETLVECKNKRVALRALAGTRKRGETPRVDAEIAAELQKDEKEMAEHLMLVDLGRNDLGRIAEPGTVQTGEIASIVRYSHVMHLSTRIHATLSSDANSFDVLRSCFPAGTVSGAPKLRAMQLLSSLEPEKRGVYSGFVGYIDLNGDADGAIAIRSALIKDGTAHVNAGAGVVYDSVAESEYEETRQKASSVLAAIRLAQSMEVASACR